MPNTSLLRPLVLSLLAATLLAACDGGNNQASDTPSDTSAAGSTPATPTYPPVDPATVKIDTTDGTLDVTGSGALSGTWSFKDVTGVLEERAFSGKTQAILSLEAHEPGPPARHFRIRMLRDNAQIEPGRYSFDSQTHMLDARFEQDTAVYRSVGEVKGWAELTSLKDDRAAGRFEITLPRFGPEGEPPQTLKGSFEQKVQR